MSNKPEIVEALVSLDGLKRWELIRRPDGLYSYSEDTFHREEPWAGKDRSEFDTEILFYWTPTYFSGLFDTVEAARHNALDRLPWLFEASRSDAEGS